MYSNGFRVGPRSVDQHHCCSCHRYTSCCCCYYYYFSKRFCVQKKNVKGYTLAGARDTVRVTKRSVRLHLTFFTERRRSTTAAFFLMIFFPSDLDRGPIRFRVVVQPASASASGFYQWPTLNYNTGGCKTQQWIGVVDRQTMAQLFFFLLCTAVGW